MNEYAPKRNYNVPISKHPESTPEIGTTAHESVHTKLNYYIMSQ
ncbi:hypothetical protein [Halobacillus dabanensis]|nr:hypothetical protein [Halobacillus dabanensis]